MKQEQFINFFFSKEYGLLNIINYLQIGLFIYHMLNKTYNISTHAIFEISRYVRNNKIRGGGGSVGPLFIYINEHINKSLYF